MHDVSCDDQFVSVQVPHPFVPDLLVWTNIWCHANLRNEPFGVSFATLVHDSVAEWEASGWHNFFLDVRP